MTALRTRTDGRKTAKKKPGRKPTSASSSDDRDLLIFIHAMHLYPRLREIIIGTKRTGAVNRELAKIAITMIDGSISEESNEPGQRKINLLIAARTSGQIHTQGQLDATADLLIKKHRAILKDRDRKDDRDYLDRHAKALHIALAPREATKKNPVLATPAGLFGVTVRHGKKAIKEAEKQHVDGSPAWVTAANIGSLYARNIDDLIKTSRDRACADLDEIGFPINQILQRLNLS